MSVEQWVALGLGVAAVIAGFWTVLVFAGKQFEAKLDARFEIQEKLRAEGRVAYEKRVSDLEGYHRELERRFLTHLAELPRDYMRREDHIRFETVINAKLDALAAKQDLLAERISSSNRG